VRTIAFDGITIVIACAALELNWLAQQPFRDESLGTGLLQERTHISETPTNRLNTGIERTLFIYLWRRNRV
jgi:hypothetical protein